MSAWHELVVDNPMMAELYRRGRRFVLSKDHRQNMYFAMLGMVVVYLVCLIAFLNMRFLTGSGVAGFKILVLCLIVPVGVHATVAGEREKRTWDAICCAPLTDAQVVAGKFAACVAMVAGVELLFLPAQLAAWSVNLTDASFGDLLTMIRLDAYAMMAGLVIGALTFLFSALSRRPFAALGGAIGMVFGVLIVGTASMSVYNADLPRNLYWVTLTQLNPIVHIQAIYSTGRDQETVNRLTNGIAFTPEIGAAIYLAVGVIALRIATKCLHYADHEGRSTPRKRKLKTHA